jgi:hypothetical protein
VIDEAVKFAQKLLRDNPNLNRSTLADRLVAVMPLLAHHEAMTMLDVAAIRTRRETYEADIRIQLMTPCTEVVQ